MGDNPNPQQDSFPYKDQTMPDEQWFENLTAYAKLGSELFSDQVDAPQKTTANPPDDAKKTEEAAKYAPGMMMHDPLEERATSSEIEQGESTEVTKLYLDRTPKH